MNWNWNWKQKSYWLRVNELELVPFQFLYPQSLGLASCFEPLVIQHHSINGCRSLFLVVFLCLSVRVALKLRSLHFTHPVCVASRYF